MTTALVWMLGMAGAFGPQAGPAPDRQVAAAEVKPEGRPAALPPIRWNFTSMLPGEEPLRPLVPAHPLTTEEERKIESKKLFTIGYMLAERKHLAEALDAYRKALDHDPQSLAVLEQIVPLCLQLDRGQEAMDYCRRALKLNPTNVELLHLRALYQKELGDVAGAIEMLEQALAAPGLQDAKGAVFLEMQLELAQLYSRQRNPEGTIRAMQAVIDVIENPRKYKLDDVTRLQLTNRQARYYDILGRALRESKNFDEAIRVLRKGRDLEGKESRLTLAIAQTLFDAGKFDEAMSELDKYLELQMQDEESLALLAKLLEKAGKSDELLTRLETMLKRDPHNNVRRRFYAQQLIAAGRATQAEEELLKVAKEPEAVALLAELYRTTSQPKKLIELLARGVSPEGGDNERRQAALRQLPVLAKDKAMLDKVADVARKGGVDEKLRFFADYIVAHAFKEAGNVDGAIEFYRRAIAAQAANILLHLELGDLLLKQERYDELITFARDAIKNQVADFELYDLLVRGLEMQGKTDEAVQTLRNYISKANDPEEAVRAEMSLAWVYQHAQQWDKAIEVCQRVIREHRSVERVAYARYMMANVYTLKGETARAEKELLQLVEGGSDKVTAGIQAAASNDLGYLWADAGKNLDQAEQMIRSAVRSKPNNAAYLDSLGWVLFKKGKNAEAVEYLRKAVELEYDADGVIWDHLGDALMANGNAAEARQAWQKAVEFYKKDSREREGNKKTQIEEKIRLLDSSKPPKEGAAKPAP